MLPAAFSGGQYRFECLDLPLLSDSAGGEWSVAEIAGQPVWALASFARPAFIWSVPGTCVSRRD